jgi:hypothetical protein
MGALPHVVVVIPMIAMIVMRFVIALMVAIVPITVMRNNASRQR